MAKSLAGRPSRKSATKPQFASPSSEFDFLSVSPTDPSDGFVFEKLMEALQTLQSRASLCVLEAAKDLERFVEESRLGVFFWMIAKKLHGEEYDDSNTVLYFADRALRIMIYNNTSSHSIPIAEILWILSFACFKLNRLDKSLKYLNWAVWRLEELENDTSQDNSLVLHNLHKAYLQLFNLKQSMGTNDGCISSMLKNLGITEKIWGKHSRELAKANLGVSNLYVTQMNYQEAIPFCLNALAIYLTCCGHNTDKIAECSNYLGLLYHEIGENGTAYEHNRLSQKLWKKLGCSSLLIVAEIHGAYLLSELGRLEEAVQSLRDVILRTEENSKDRTIALTCLAAAFVKQEEFADARECAEIVCGILGRKESCIYDDAVVFANVAEVYTELYESETALSLMQKAQAIMQAQQKIPTSILNISLGEVSVKVIALFLEAGKFGEAITHLEVAVETTKMSFGSKHLKVGEVYDKLGYAYLHTNKLHLSSQAFGYAKDIFDESLGPLHDSSIMTCKLLCTAYVAMGSYSPAITFLEEAIKCMEEVGPSAQEYLAEAAILLDELKEMASYEISGKDSQSGSTTEATNILKEKEVIEDDEVELLKERAEALEDFKVEKEKEKEG